MADKPNAIYAPGELGRVRDKLGVSDEAEAKRMAKLLGGEVGTERKTPSGSGSRGGIKRSTGTPGGAGGGAQGAKPPVRRVQMLEPEEESEASLKKAMFATASGGDPLDDPSVQLKTSYFERVRMDRYAAQMEFEIKSSLQALVSILSFFGDPPDYVNSRFISRRMSKYFRKIEQLVNATRTLLPRNNIQRSERLKRNAPAAYNIIDTIRFWNTEKIAGDMAKIQSHHRSARVSEFADILRAIYKPLFVLEQLDIETHIKGAYKLLYKMAYLENPAEPKSKNQEMVRVAIASFADIRREVHYGLYPLLMKLISDRWIPYEQLFFSRRRRFMAFINASDETQIQAASIDIQQFENGDLDTIKEEIKQEQAEADGTAAGEDPEAEDPNDPEVIARKAKAAAQEAEIKAIEHSQNALESLFPKAGWDKLSEYPDLYPYFADIYNLRKGYELISPSDPLQQTAVLMHILEDILIGLRSTVFGTVTGADGIPSSVEEVMVGIILNWRRYIDDSFVKEYLPRLSEYCRLLENSAESRTSVYAKRTLNELHWTKRLYFLPYYKFESLGPPPFQKQETTPLYGEVRTLRKYLVLVAAGIEQGNRMGGAETKAACDGIDNPWEPYHFEVPNPVSKRLDALLPPARRNNAALIFFALSATTTLDYILNNETSWAYGDRPGMLFRSVNGEGSRPMFGVDNKLDADQIFKDTMKQKEGERAQPVE
jgi:hypothetical protein